MPKFADIHDFTLRFISNHASDYLLPCQVLNLLLFFSQLSFVQSRTDSGVTDVIKVILNVAFEI